jgi:hypothetical protein
MKKLSLLLLTSLFLSCQTAQVPDSPICVELNVDRGFCRWTISDKKQIVDETHKIMLSDGKEYTWWELKPATLKMPYTTWAEIKKFIYTVCKENQTCSTVTNWQQTVDDIDKWVNENVTSK